ncbi:helix-turn-helix domain-containing protein [Cupriavidus gilardii]|uniref:Helix-turn-helix domain-containing protein n=1 Tax=Cupriavidus gilardii TaxID=82541 RepID=A0ABY4W281_9BURK|nr:YdaS family helix-turn-helix protein [Cupriavidus gilardii]USE81135.1 helix-turn-helix domain-containing protein [Cupriavidus gilardii]
MNTPLNQSALASAVDALGGLSKAATALNVTTNRLANWLKRGVPAERCPDIEAATGVPCEVLRPDVNWQVLRRIPTHVHSNGELQQSVVSGDER